MNVFEYATAASRTRSGDNSHTITYNTRLQDNQGHVKSGDDSEWLGNDFWML